MKGRLNLRDSLPILNWLNRRLRALSRDSSGMEFAAVPLPPFAFRVSSGNRGDRENFISTIYSTTPIAIFSCPAGNEVAGMRIFPQGPREKAARMVESRASRQGRKEIHDGKD
jgi:hypothetical protein